MSTQDTDVDLINVEFVNIHVGDTVTLAYHGHEFTGTAWESRGDLCVGDMALYVYDGRYSERVFVSATRPAPETCWNGDEIVDGKAYLVRYGAVAPRAILRAEGQWRWLNNAIVTDQSAVIKPLCALPLTPEQLNEALA
jgi:hypothetical protein